MIFFLAAIILLAVFLAGMFVGSWLVIPPPKQPPRLRLVDTRPFNGEVDAVVNQGSAQTVFGLPVTLDAGRSVLDSGSER